MKASLKVVGIALIRFSLTVCLCDNSADVSGTIPEAWAAGGAADTPHTPYTSYTPHTPYTPQMPPWNVSETQPSASGISITSSVDLLTDAEINGSRQKLLIEADDTDNPILLFIHGGPGDSTMMLSHAYSDLLRSRSIFVNWDQRGSGLSWQEDMDESKINEDQLVDDTLEYQG